jgi:hypothetical protein
MPASQEYVGVEDSGLVEIEEDCIEFVYHIVVLVSVNSFVSVRLSCR